MGLENEILRGRRVLVVDDEFLIAAFLKEVIEETGAIVVGPANSYADALKLAETETVDAALLDVNLAGKQSYPIATLLRARDVKLAFLTGMGTHALPAEFRDVATLTKPVDIDTLLATLEKFLR